ncbi:hypothetical protein MXD61_21100 [Frankia sp. AgPm24]|uniref:hypothetical protein n=1 Tax=Frankia sp. AgPm24 TaxID=631128 RepID=UPI00200D5F69|nr:hypothetical protein [Frankia sp. AgPm24]MCK9924333.1 hypothetical protein [Frankia sp. AgPm24]
MTDVDAARAATADALAVARRVQAEVEQALDQVNAAGVAAWEGAAAEQATQRLRRLAVEAAAVLASCVRLCEQAGLATGPPQPPPPSPPSPLSSPSGRQAGPAS